MHSKGTRCFYLKTGHDHSSTAHTVLLGLGVASYTADVTFGYHRRPFVGESPTWSDGAVVSSPPSPQQQQRPSHSMRVGGGARAVKHQRERPQQQQWPAHSMVAGGGAGAVEPQLMGAGGGPEAVEHQRARPQQQQQQPPHSMGAGVGAGAE